MMDNRDVLGAIAIGSALMMVAVIMGAFAYGIINDYGLFYLHNITATFSDMGLISSGITTSTDSAFATYLNTINYFDWFWLMSYISFVGTTVYISYITKSDNEFGFLTMLLYGTMIILFIVSIMEVFTNWLNVEILTAVMPNVINAMPKFNYYISHIGMFSFIHALVCLIVNKIDIKLGDSVKKSDVEFIDSNEVL